MARATAAISAVVSRNARGSRPPWGGGGGGGVRSMRESERRDSGSRQLGKAWRNPPPGLPHKGGGGAAAAHDAVIVGVDRARATVREALDRDGGAPRRLPGQKNCIGLETLERLREFGDTGDVGDGQHQRAGDEVA